MKEMWKEDMLGEDVYHYVVYVKSVLSMGSGELKEHLHITFQIQWKPVVQKMMSEDH